MSNKYLDFEGLSYYNEQINPAIINAIDDTTKNWITSTSSGAGANFDGTFTYTGNGTWHVEGTTLTIDAHFQPLQMYITDYGLTTGDKVVIKHNSTTDNLCMRLVPHSISQGYLTSIKNDNANKYAEYVIGSDIDYLLIRIQCVAEVGVSINGDITPMVCRYENYKLSNAVIPYTISNQEITEIIRNPISNSDIDNVWDGI